MGVMEVLGLIVSKSQIRMLLLIAAALMLNGCAAYVASQVVGGAIMLATEATEKKSTPAPTPKKTSPEPTGCIIGNADYYIYSPAYCKQRGGLVTKNYNVECRYVGKDKREITQEWRCKQNGGYVYAAVSPNTVTGVLKAQTTPKTGAISAPLPAPAPVETVEGLVRCELKQSGVITGYVEVSEQICRDLTGG